MKTILQIFACLAVLVAVFIGGRCSHRPENIISERVDTIIVRDTIRDTVPVVKYSLTTRIDTVYLLAVGDSTADSVAVEVPIERKVYETNDYRAEIEGYRPSLVSMNIYRRTEQITKIQRVSVPDTRRWGIGVQAGYGMTVKNGKVVAMPYLGVGVSYSLWRW